MNNLIQKYKSTQTVDTKHLNCVNTLIQEGMNANKALHTVASAYGYDFAKFHEAFDKYNEKGE